MTYKELLVPYNPWWDLANQVYNGVDTNGNENIEAIPGEGGVMTAYDHSYYMADILLKP